jgi:hypothetical protein
MSKRPLPRWRGSNTGEVQGRTLMTRRDAEQLLHDAINSLLIKMILSRGYAAVVDQLQPPDAYLKVAQGVFAKECSFVFACGQLVQAVAILSDQNIPSWTDFQEILLTKGLSYFQRMDGANLSPAALSKLATLVSDPAFGSGRSRIA